MGWTMNDLRNQNRALAPVQELGPTTGDIVSAPGSGGPRRGGRPSTARRDRDRGRASARGPSRTEDREQAPRVRPDDDGDVEPDGDGDRSLNFPVSRQLEAMPVSARVDDEPGDDADGLDHDPDRDGASAADGDEPGSDSGPSGAPSRRAAADARSSRARRRSEPADSPASRPSRRRDEADVAEAEQAGFSWDFKYDDEDEDDKPDEFQPTGRLLSRAFRSSVG